MVTMSHNFYKFECSVRTPRDRKGELTTLPMPQYYAACLLKVRRGVVGTAAATTPTCCVNAISGKYCPAIKMMAEEMSGQVRYYHDRDDIGPGVMRRSELGLERRTPEEAAKHRAWAEKLGLKVRDVTPEEDKVLAEVAERSRARAASSAFVVPMTRRVAQPQRSIRSEAAEPAPRRTIAVPQAVPVKRATPAALDLAGMINEELRNG